MNDMPPETSITDEERDDLERFCGITGKHVGEILHRASIHLAANPGPISPIQ